jgi:hypothetical protein
MRRAWQDGESGIGHSGTIPPGILLTAAEQLEERHRVRCADTIGIPTTINAGTSIAAAS